LCDRIRTTQQLRYLQVKVVGVSSPHGRHLLTMLIASETQSFLHDPAHKIDTFYTSDEFQPYKDNTARQLRHILINGSARWAITALTCILYAAATIIWQNKVAISELSKRLYNTITTGVSIAMGLNVASAFKDMALNMRWVVLSHQKFSLNEVSTALFSRYTNAYGFFRWILYCTQTLCKDFSSFVL
jgi:hypothetical protein